MGATKRVTEFLAIAASRQSSLTKTIIVRFGNVLDSDGAVVPLFRRQIEKGGPVTVTDPAAMRYFMTISEATLLVLEASALGESGQLMVLKMGEPVRILDLARDMITLAGYSPGEDIAIQFIGLRPGEKLEEELFSAEDNLISSRHEKMYVAQPPAIDRETLEDALIDLRQLSARADRPGIIARLKELVPSYEPRKIENINKEVKG